MTFRIDKFNSGRAQFNRRAQSDVIATHYYAPPEGETFSDIKAAGYFGGAAPFLISGDIIVVENPNANPRMFAVDQAVVAVTVQEMQLPLIGAILTTTGGGLVETFSGGLAANDLPNVSIRTTAVAGLAIEQQTIVDGEVQVTFSADPLGTTTLNLFIYPSLT